MPVSILDIEINDEQFKAYLERFQKYQEQVKQMPGLWGAQAESVGAVASGFAMMTAALVAQTAELHKQDKLENEMAKKKAAEAQKEKDRDRERAEREKQARARRQEMIEDVRTLGRNVASTVTDVAKWATLGGGAALAGGALSFWGLDKFVESVGQERRLASGYGISTGERQALGVNLQRYMDVNGVLENVANAQNDPNKWWTFATMGINPMGKNAAQLTTETMMRARQMFISDKGNLAMAGAQGLLNIFSPDELRRLAATPEGELRGAVGQAQRDIGRFQLSDQVNAKWQAFVVNLDEASTHLKNVLVNDLTRMEPDLQVLINKFTVLADQVLNRIDFKALGDGLDTFTNFVTSKQFQADFKTVIDDISQLGSELVKALAFFHLIPDPGAGGAPPPAGATAAGVPTMTVPLPRGLNGSASPFFGLVGGGRHGTELWTAENMNPAGSQFMKWGWTEAQAAGIMANLRAESGLDPFAQGDKDRRTGAYMAYGIAQWHADRQAIYAQLFGHTMQSVKDPQQALREQLEFVQYELTKGMFKKAGDDLRKINSKFGAGFEVTTEYERPKDMIFTPRIRGAEAMVITIKQTPNPAGGSVAATANAAAAGG